MGIKVMETVTQLGWIIIEYSINKGLDYVFRRETKKALIYKQDNYLLSDVYGAELLKSLLEEHDLRLKDLASIFRTRTECIAVLHGQQELTLDHIQKLSDLFHISPLAFFPSKTEFIQS
ncbi:hypothetical protein C7B76_11345 [filamentous cyanobacterium CCP2]|nr:hypothetical protein C7B76_11345 [filamentous cyanobacterium CCP2]